MKKIIAAASAALMMLSAAAALPAKTNFAPPISVSAAVYENDSFSEYAEYAAQVAELVNKERAAYGLKALEMSDKLCEAANVRAAEIQISFSHTRPSGKSCFTALSDKGISYRYAAENIAYGQRDPEAVMRAWMNSSGHRANILSQNADYIGVGVAYKNGTYYWTQFFAKADGLAGETVTKPAVTTAAPQTSAPEEVTTAVTTRPSAVTTTTTTTTTTSASAERPVATTTRQSTAVTEKPAEVITTAAPRIELPIITAPKCDEAAPEGCESPKSCLGPGALTSACKGLCPQMFFGAACNGSNDCNNYLSLFKNMLLNRGCK